MTFFYLFFYQNTGFWPGKHTLPYNFRESNTKRVPFGRPSFFVFYSPWRERLLCINIHNSVTVTYLFFHYLEAKGKPLKPQMLLLFMNQLSSYQRHQEVQYAVQHLWQRVKYDVTRLPPGFFGSGVRLPASAQVVMRRARWMRHPLCDTVTRPVWHDRWPQDDTLVCRQTCWSLQLSGFVTQGDVAWDVCDSGWAPFGNVIRRNWTWFLFFSSFGPCCAR